MDPAVLRLLDANANRAREALRVLEDYARFIRDDAVMSAALKNIRHDLGMALADILPTAIGFRDTAGDVGTANTTASEMTRANLADVVTAAGKRLGEALRTLEEYAKIVDPAAAAKVERQRYRFYDLERLIVIGLHPRNRMADVRLYVLITEAHCRLPWPEAAEQAIAGGADCLQLREKSLDGGEFLARAKQFVALCRRHQVLSIINDRADIAVLADADGVHVGQGDLPAREARKLLGVKRIVGVSTHRIEQARAAVEDGADYIGVGPIFPSATKPRDFVAGLEYARAVAGTIKLPAMAIAGITLENIDQVLATGMKAVAVTAAVTATQDVTAAAQALKQRLNAAKIR